MRQFVAARTLRDLDSYRLYTPACVSTEGGPVNLGDEGESSGGFHLTGSLVRGWCRVKFGGSGIDTGSGRLMLRMPLRRDVSLMAGAGTGAAAPAVALGRLRQSGSGGANSQLIVGQFFGTAPLNVDHVFFMQHASNNVITGAAPFTITNNSRISIRFAYPANPDALAELEEPA